MDWIIVRQAVPEDAPAIARVHVDAWRTTYGGIMPDAFLARLSYEVRERQWVRNFDDAAAGGRVIYVAVAVTDAEGEASAERNEAGQIVGFAVGGPEESGEPEYAGEVYAIYLLEPYQRRGIGQRLFRSVARWLAETGRRSLLVWVAAQNPSRGFYAALGGTPVRERQIEIGGALIDEVAYAWKDVAPLLSAGDGHRL